MTFYKFARGVIRGFLHLIFRIRIEGIENIPKEGVRVICPNHKSNFDPLLLAICLPFAPRFMAKEELFRIKAFGAVLRMAGAFPIKRGKSDIGALRSAMKMLENGENLVIFPEGKRSRKATLSRGKQGAALIAIKTGVNILPVGIEGNYRLFGKMTVRIGKEIPLEKYFGQKVSSEELQYITDEGIMPAIAELAGVKTYEY